MKSMCKHWGLHISTNTNCLGIFLGSFWVVWRGLFWCPKPKLRLWWFLRYWRFNKRYHGGYQLICLISQPLLIASRHDWYRSKGLLKGFKLALRPWELLKNWWRYGWMKFVTLSITPGLGTLLYRDWQFRFHLWSHPLSAATVRGHLYFHPWMAWQHSGAILVCLTSDTQTH